MTEYRREVRAESLRTSHVKEQVVRLSSVRHFVCFIIISLRCSTVQTENFCLGV
jgi:hypothetical protein